MLMRNLGFPSRSGFIAKTALVFFETAERRSWLVDGASALLHLVRVERDSEMVKNHVTLRDKISKIACWLEILLEAPAHSSHQTTVPAYLEGTAL
jgi:hypothetical protein